MALAYGIMAFGALVNVAFHAVTAPRIPFSILPLVLYSVGSALAMPSLTLMALDLLPHRKGLASSCQALVQSGGNALVTALLAPALWGSALTLAAGQLMLVAVGAVSFAAYRLFRGMAPAGQAL